MALPRRDSLPFESNNQFTEPTFTPATPGFSFGQKAAIQTVATPFAAVLATLGWDVLVARAQVPLPRHTSKSIGTVAAYKVVSGTIKSNSAGQGPKFKESLEARLESGGVGEKTEGVPSASSRQSIIATGGAVTFATITSSVFSHFPSLMATIRLVNPDFYNFMVKTPFLERVRKSYGLGFSGTFAKELPNIVAYVVIVEGLRGQIDALVPEGYGLPLSLALGATGGTLADTAMTAARNQMIKDTYILYGQVFMPGFIESGRKVLDSRGVVSLFLKGFRPNFASTLAAYGAIKGVSYCVENLPNAEDPIVSAPKAESVAKKEEAAKETVETAATVQSSPAAVVSTARVSQTPSTLYSARKATEAQLAKAASRAEVSVPKKAVTVGP